MAAANKTIGPLHLEDLEPHRFEDLVRQLLYDFRPWRDLEATGRSGSDAGFDARGWERVLDNTTSLDDDSEQGDSETDDEGFRQWLIQCKREKSIAPTKLDLYLTDLPKVLEQNLYGIIFVAACDFSMKARNTFYRKTRELGFQEVKLWGKAEIEDQLFQPKNDHLLFAYFGISLQVRQRSMKTAIRTRLSTKRKAKKHLVNFQPVLIRDVTDDRYPYPDPNKDLKEHDRRRWHPYSCHGCFHDGVYFIARRSLAFIDDDGIHWDVAEAMNDGIPHENPWRTEGQNTKYESLSAARGDAMRIWDQLPERNKAWLEVYFILSYENILAVDEEGDEFFQKPHIYVNNPNNIGWFNAYRRLQLENISQWDSLRAVPIKSTRVHKFPRSIILDEDIEDFYAEESKAIVEQ